MKVEVEGVGTRDVDSFDLPADSIFRKQFDELVDAEESDGGVERVRLLLEEDDLLGDSTWLSWYKQHPERALSVRFFEGERSIWVEVWPTRSESDPFVWITVIHEVGVHFDGQLDRGKSMSATAISKLSKGWKAEVEKAKRGGRPVPANVVDAYDAAKALRNLLRNPSKGRPISPLEIRDWWYFKAEGKEPTGRAVELIEAWRAFCSIPDHPLGDGVELLVEYLDGIQSELKRGLWSSSFRPLDGVLYNIGSFRVVAGRMRALYRNQKRESLGNYELPDFTIATEQLLLEFKAFAAASRRAASHQVVFGGLLENRVSEFVAKAVAPLRVSSGSLAGLPAVHQLDLIIWDPSVAPAVSEEGGVAVVSPNAVVGVLELKASMNLGEFANRIEEIRDDLVILRREGVSKRVQVPVLGLVVADPKEYSQVRLLSEGTLTVLFQGSVSGGLVPNMAGIEDFVSFVYDRVLPANRASSLLRAEEAKLLTQRNRGVW